MSIIFILEGIGFRNTRCKRIVREIMKVKSSIGRFVTEYRLNIVISFNHSCTYAKQSKVVVSVDSVVSLSSLERMVRMLFGETRTRWKDPRGRRCTPETAVPVKITALSHLVPFPSRLYYGMEIRVGATTCWRPKLPELFNLGPIFEVPLKCTSCAFQPADCCPLLKASDLNFNIKLFL